MISQELLYEEKMNIKSIYDNNSRTFDRYTVILSDGSALGLSVNPDSPMGFSQWSEAVEGSHLGQRISFKELPLQIRKHIERRLSLE
jgi:hypothetical protein